MAAGMSIIVAPLVCLRTTDALCFRLSMQVLRCDASPRLSAVTARRDSQPLTSGPLSALAISGVCVCMRACVCSSGLWLC